MNFKSQETNIYYIIQKDVSDVLLNGILIELKNETL